MKELQNCQERGKANKGEFVETDDFGTQSLVKFSIPRLPQTCPRCKEDLCDLPSHWT